MWPFTRKPTVERALPTPPSVSGLTPNGHTGDLWGSLGLDTIAMSPAAAESVAAVGAAVSAIATTLAALPCAVVRADEQRDEVPTHDLARLIRDGANENEDWPSFIET